jgi:hypothetical protein
MGILLTFLGLFVLAVVGFVLKLVWDAIKKAYVAPVVDNHVKRVGEAVKAGWNSFKESGSHEEMETHDDPLLQPISPSPAPVQLPFPLPSFHQFTRNRYNNILWVWSWQGGEETPHPDMISSLTPICPNPECRNIGMKIIDDPFKDESASLSYARCMLRCPNCPQALRLPKSREDILAEVKGLIVQDARNQI